MKRTVRLLIAGLALAQCWLASWHRWHWRHQKWDVKRGKGQRSSSLRENWARDYIEQMALAGVLKELAMTSLLRTKSVESVQILVMLVRGLGLEEKALIPTG